MNEISIVFMSYILLCDAFLIIQSPLRTTPFDEPLPDDAMP